MQTSAMKACFQIAEGSLSYAKLIHSQPESKYFTIYRLKKKFGETRGAQKRF